MQCLCDKKYRSAPQEDVALKAILLPWHVTARTRRVWHDTEHVPPSERQGRGIVNITISRICVTSWKHCAVPQSADDTRLFGCYERHHARLVSQGVH